MFPLTDMRGYHPNILEEAICGETINLFDPTDIVSFFYASELKPPVGYVMVALYGYEDGFGIHICNELGLVEQRIAYSTEKVADEIVDSGLWNGEPIILLACHTGLKGIESPGQEIADLMGVLTYAPLEKVHLGNYGFYYINDVDITDPNDYRLGVEYQADKWAEFLPITY